MNLHQRVKAQLKERKARLERGQINSIPFPFRALNRYVPGIMPETQYGLTTVSGAGKTLFATNIFVQHPFDFWLQNKDKMDIDVKIFLFCLEDSADLTMKRMQIRALYEQLGIRIGMFKFNSFLAGDKMDDATEAALDVLDPYFEQFLSKVELIDDIRSPMAIYHKIKTWLEQPDNGQIVDIHGNALSKREQNEAATNYQKTFYKSSHNNRFPIVIVDNLQNIKGGDGEKGKWQALDLFCRELCRDSMVGKYKCTTLLISQQDKSKEKIQYTNDGDAVAEKHIPDVSSIAEYKNVVDTCHVYFGLFYPWKYRIESYPNEGYPYDITRLQDFYRNLHILKSNFVEANISTSLLFDGVTGMLSELPPADDQDAMNKVYRYVEDMMRLKQGLVPLKLT